MVVVADKKKLSPKKEQVQPAAETAENRFKRGRKKGREKATRILIRFSFPSFLPSFQFSPNTQYPKRKAYITYGFPKS